MQATTEQHELYTDIMNAIKKAQEAGLDFSKGIKVGYEKGKQKIEVDIKVS